jgi:3-hydroxyisobutyrate dehydrogenase
MDMTERLGLIGVGNMGRPIAENILRKGFHLVVYDIRDHIKEEMSVQGTEISSSPAELARKSKIIFLVVNNSDDVKDVLFASNGVAKEASSGTIVVDMTTSDPQTSKQFANRLSKRGIEYLDAPVTGGVLGARKAQLFMMVGGRRETYEKCLPIFEVISKEAVYMGGAGSGHLIKLIHNQVAHSTFLAACEGIVLGEKLGLSVDAMVEVFNQGTARSYATEVRFPKYILSGTYEMGATFSTVYKDMSLVRKLGRIAGMQLPITNCTYNYWRYPIEKGEGDEDCAKVILKMKRMLSK